MIEKDGNYKEKAFKKNVCLRLYNMREYKKSRVKTIQEGFKQKMKFSYSKREDCRNSREKKISKWGSRLRIWSEYLSAKEGYRLVALCLTRSHMKEENEAKAGEWMPNDWMTEWEWDRDRHRDMLLQSGYCRRENRGEV